MTDPTTALAARLRGLEDREQIRELVARYCYVMDDRDLQGMIDLFTEDVVVASSDGMMDSQGRDAVVAMFQGRWAVLGPSLHWTHDQIVVLDEGDPDRATGLVQCHAEMTRSGEPRLSSIRYADEFRRCADGRWRFARRVLSFFYFVSPVEYAEALGAELRVRAYERPMPAGFPESLETWRRYYAEHPR